MLPVGSAGRQDRTRRLEHGMGFSAIAAARCSSAPRHWCVRRYQTLSLGIWLMLTACQERPLSYPEVAALPVRSSLPDPLIMADGRPVTSAAQWAARRQEMQGIIEYYAIGHAPPPPSAVIGREIASRSLLHGTVLCRLVHCAWGPGNAIGFDIEIFIPNGVGGPLPTIVQPAFAPNLTLAQPVAAWDASAQRYTAALQRGYAVATFFYQQCGLDRKTGSRQTGFFPAYPTYDWGDLVAWAWGMSRCVDYLETQTFVDRSQVIAVGHSRLGKAALIAGAFDTRFAMTAPAGAGCAGTGAYRYNGSQRGGREGLEDVVKNFPQWFGPHFGDFSGHVLQLPFDQHWLLALIAPRLCLPCDGLNDRFTNGNALIQSYVAARRVYAWLGVPDHLGIAFRPGPHELALEDWQALLDFADLHLRHRPVARRFDVVPALDRFTIANLKHP